MEDNFPRSVAAYKHFDVLLVNAVRDGMNLVAKESAVINEKGGVLVLSENAGAHEELGSTRYPSTPTTWTDRPTPSTPRSPCPAKKASVALGPCARRSSPTP